MTVSSDAFGSLPVFNEKGELIKYGVGKPTSLLDTIRVLRDKYSWKLEEILPLVTSQPAECYSLTMKGRIEEGKSTDLVILDETTLEIKYVVSKGRILKTPTWTHTGMF
jgi:beta-aspartyl-dipeptidase (metallo-type)